MRTPTVLYDSRVTGVFPDAKAKDASTETAFDGSPSLAINIDDLTLGWLQALLTLNGDTPDGQPELKDDSQILDNLRQMAAFKELQTIAASGALVFGKRSFSIELDTTGGNLAISTLPLPDFIGQTVDFVVRGAGIATIAAGNGIIFDQDIRVDKGRSIVGVEVSGAPQWELSVDEKRICKAWVNFNGTGVVAIRDEYNTSSITDNAVGDYTQNFINAMNDTNYSCVVTSAQVPAGSVNYSAGPKSEADMLVGSVRILSQQSNGDDIDLEIFSAQIFGS